MIEGVGAGEVAASRTAGQGDIDMEEDKKTEVCLCIDKHEQHICFLHSKGRVQEVEKLTDNPTVTCSICLVNANSPENVCSPTTLGFLGGDFKYSDMRDSKKIICDSVLEGQAEKKESGS